MGERCGHTARSEWRAPPDPSTTAADLCAHQVAETSMQPGHPPPSLAAPPLSSTHPPPGLAGIRASKACPGGSRTRRPSVPAAPAQNQRRRPAARLTSPPPGLRGVWKSRGHRAAGPAPPTATTQPSSSAQASGRSTAAYRRDAALVLSLGAVAVPTHILAPLVGLKAGARLAGARRAHDAARDAGVGNCWGSVGARAWGRGRCICAGG